MTETPQSTTPWHAAFPNPSNPNPPSITASTLLARLQAQRKQTTAPTFLLVDLRRTDHEGGTIRTSLNLPAQTLYYSLPTLYTLCRNAGVEEVIFYCGACALVLFIHRFCERTFSFVLVPAPAVTVPRGWFLGSTLNRMIFICSVVDVSVFCHL